MIRRESRKPQRPTKAVRIALEEIIESKGPDYREKFRKYIFHENPDVRLRSLEMFESYLANSTEITTFQLLVEHLPIMLNNPLGDEDRDMGRIIVATMCLVDFSDECDWAIHFMEKLKKDKEFERVLFQFFLLPFGESHKEMLNVFYQRLMTEPDVETLKYFTMLTTCHTSIDDNLLEITNLITHLLLLDDKKLFKMVLTLVGVVYDMIEYRSEGESFVINVKNPILETFSRFTEREQFKLQDRLDKTMNILDGEIPETVLRIDSDRGKIRGARYLFRLKTTAKLTKDYFLNILRRNKHARHFVGMYTKFVETYAICMCGCYDGLNVKEYNARVRHIEKSRGKQAKDDYMGY